MKAYPKENIETKVEKLKSNNNFPEKLNISKSEVLGNQIWAKLIETTLRVLYKCPKVPWEVFFAHLKRGRREAHHSCIFNFTH